MALDLESNVQEPGQNPAQGPTPEPFKPLRMTYDNYVDQSYSDVGVPQDEKPPKAGEKKGIVGSIVAGAKDIVSHPIESAKSLARGVVDAVSQTAQTLVEIGGIMSDPAGIAKSQRDGFIKDMGAAFGHANDAIFGPRSLKQSQGFVEDTANFLAGFIGAGKFKAIGSIKSAVTRGLVKGAVADFAAFDPYQAQLAELAAQTHVPGMRELGQVLSVEGDDGPMVARMKRAIGGAIPGVAIDGLVAGARLFRANKVLTNPAASAAEREAAADVIEQQAKVLNDIDAGTHNTGDPVQVRPDANGQWNLFEQGQKEPISSHATRWEAEEQAGVVNAALAERFDAKMKVTDQTVQDVLSLAKKLEAAKDNPEALVQLMQNEARFNYNYLNAPDKVESLMKSVGETLSTAFDKAQGRPSVTWAESMERSRTLAGMIPREEAQAFIEANSKYFHNTDALLGFMDSWMVESGEKVAKWAEILEQRPGDVVAMQEARLALQSWAELQGHVAGAKSGIARGLNFLKNEGRVQKGMQLAGETENLADATRAGAGAVSELTDQEVRGMVQIFRQSQQPKVLFNAVNAIAEARGATRSQIATGRILGTFYNAVLSHPAVWKAVFTANMATNAFQDGVRAMAGALTGNSALFREGADLLQGRLIYWKQSLKGMGMALKAGHSIIDPHPRIEWFDIKSTLDAEGKNLPSGAVTKGAGQVIRSLGSRPMAAMDEFWRVNSNMAYVRMKALRSARVDAEARGLKGAELKSYLDERVEAEVAASIDKNGVSRRPDAREFAIQPTFSGPLRPGSFGADLENLVKKHPALVPIAPFVRTSINVTRYSFVKNSPLGLFFKDMRETFARGGEEGAIAATQMAAGTTIWGTAALMAFGGEITGNGPTNPELRKMWLANNQPYSFKIGGKWVSYRRLDPFATPLAVVADLAHVMRDHGSDPEIAEGGAKVYYGILAATMSGMTSKTYLSGLVDFMNAIGSKDVGDVKSFVDRLMIFPIPSGLQVFNKDPYLRETKGMFDAFINKIPGYSQTLPARYNAFGEPIMVTPSRSDRAFNAFPVTDVQHNIPEEELLQLQKALLPPPTTETVGKYTINLHDRSYANTKGGTLTPYERWMELIRDKGLRGQVENVISSSAYDGMGDGIDGFPGGRRYAAIRDRYERVMSQTRRQMLTEYPALRKDLDGLKRVKRAAARSDTRAESILERIGK